MEPVFFRVTRARETAAVVPSLIYRNFESRIESKTGSSRGVGLASFSGVLMVRVLCLLLAMMLSGTCSALEIQRVAACSGVVLRLRGDFRDGDYARFKSQFRKTDVVIGLDLSSAGGDIEEGVQIANLAHEKKLSVFVAGHLSFSRRPSAILAQIRELASIRYPIVGTSKTSVPCG